ncbi:MAG: thioredoxin family protein [Saprospiraceae bacterium]|nr:thioredoxin family protein [Saprospiraceae bacterium]MDW8228363.1 thioredoxin family protein [Saprospiraceae bacterium]
MFMTYARLFAVMALFLASAGPFCAQGIRFFEGKWPEAQAKAKAEERLIFADAFASWCGPCKRMAATVFTDPKVGEFFNEHFVNVKYDMEKPENAEFARKYPVGAYPTLMILDADGKVVQKHVGAMTAEGLIAFGQKALGLASVSKDVEKEYEAGNRDPDLVLRYIRSLNRANKPSLKVTNDYLNARKDYNDTISRQIILEGAVEADSRVFDLLVANRAAISAQEGAQKVNDRILLACKNTVKKAIEFRDARLLEEAKTKVKTNLPTQAEEFAFDADMRYHAAAKDAKNYLKAAQGYQKKIVRNDAARLHELVTKMLAVFPKDADVLNQAEKWAKTAAETGGLGEYYLTLADIYRRKGDKANARTAAEKALKAPGAQDNLSLKNRVEVFLQTLE